MNKVLAIISFCILTILAIHPANAQTDSEEATSSASSEDVIRENVKRRIQEVVKGDTDIQLTSIAYTGTLTSIANDTLTISTQDGIKLASTSAQTVIEDEDEDEAETEDLAIDTYIVALGFINGSQVLDVRKIIIHQEPPVPSTTQSEYGIITSYDLEEDTITVTNPFTNQPTTATLQRTTDYLEVNPTGKPIPTDEDAIIVNQSTALIIYEPGEDNLIASILIKNNPQATTQTPTTATDSAEQELPPELQ